MFSIRTSIEVVLQMIVPFFGLPPKCFLQYLHLALSSPLIVSLTKCAQISEKTLPAVPPTLGFLVLVVDVSTTIGAAAASGELATSGDKEGGVAGEGESTGENGDGDGDGDADEELTFSA